jgi:hypothetical protein
MSYWPEADAVLVGTALRAGGRLMVMRLTLPALGGEGEWEVVSEARLGAPVRSCAGAADGVTLALAAGCLVHALALLRPLRPACPSLRLRGIVPALTWLPAAPHGAPLLALLDERDGVHVARVDAGTEGRIALLASERRQGPAVALAALPQRRLAVADRSGRVAIFCTDGLAETGPFRPTLRPLVVVQLPCVPVRLCALPDGALYVVTVGGSVHRIRPFACTSAQAALLHRLESVIIGAAHATVSVLQCDVLGSLIGMTADAQRRAVQAASYEGDAREAMALVERAAGRDCATFNLAES